MLTLFMSSRPVFVDRFPAELVFAEATGGNPLPQAGNLASADERRALRLRQNGWIILATESFRYCRLLL